MKNYSIGIFDSGIGGLTVAKHLINILPNENIVYFGDTARVPYGSRSDETILKYGLQDIKFLKSKNVKLIIAACGTVSSVFFKNNINNLYFKNIFYTGVIEPTVQKAFSITKNKRIGIIGTKATIKSKAYEFYLNQLDSNIEILSKPCPLFVSLVEEGLFSKNNNIVMSVIDFYLSDLKKSKIDTLILGCTHYPLLADAISSYFNNTINLVDPGKETAKFIKTYLTKNNLLNNNGGNREFFVSDGLYKFEYIANQFLGYPIKNINIVNLEEIDK